MHNTQSYLCETEHRIRKFLNTFTAEPAYSLAMATENVKYKCSDDYNVHVCFCKQTKKPLSQQDKLPPSEIFQVADLKTKPKIHC